MLDPPLSPYQEFLKNLKNLVVQGFFSPESKILQNCLSIHQNTSPVQRGKYFSNYAHPTGGGDGAG